MSGEKRECKLKEVFGSEHFTEIDISRVLALSKSTAHYTAHKLLKQKKIARIAKGRYVFSEHNLNKVKIYKEIKEPIIEYLKSSLSHLEKKFRITGISYFNRFYSLSFSHQSYDSGCIPNYIVIYVEKGTSEQVSSYLSSLPLKFVVLAEPKIEDIALLIDKANLHNFIILRENNYALSETGECSLELAFVDYYFEVTRQKLPVENKTEEILDYLLLHNSINLTSLLRYAKERGIKKEVEELFKDIKFLTKKHSESKKLPERQETEQIQKTQKNLESVNNEKQ